MAQKQQGEMKMIKKTLGAIAFTIAATQPVFAEGVTHQIAFHVDQNDPRVMNMALKNVQNVTAYCESIGDTVGVQVVM